ncbi:MAG: hypothetical protein M3217_08115 [Actinomycetota bacterium]|nr:hypothetical protein [Actinomycetota bacterium]
MKLKRIRNIAIATALAAVSVIPAVGANASSAAAVSLVQTDIAYKVDGAHIALAPCQATAQANPGSPNQTVYVAGEATATGAVAVRIFCGVVQNGVVKGGVQNALPGSAAATAGTVSVPIAPYTVCADVYALFPDGRDVFDYNCPAH